MNKYVIKNIAELGRKVIDFQVEPLEDALSARDQRVENQQAELQEIDEQFDSGNTRASIYFLRAEHGSLLEKIGRERTVLVQMRGDCFWKHN